VSCFAEKRNDERIPAATRRPFLASGDETLTTFINGAASGGRILPREIRSKEEFQRLVEKATEVRVVRNGAEAKVKLRASKVLYTFKTSTEEADTLTKGLKVEVLEY